MKRRDQLGGYRGWRGWLLGAGILGLIGCGVTQPADLADEAAAETSAQTQASLSGPALLTCTTGDSIFAVNHTTGAVDGAIQLDGCAVLGRPDLHSATVDITGHTALVTALKLDIVSTDTITWNTGETQTQAMLRTFTGLSVILEVGTGDITAGLFHPAVTAETALGTRSPLNNNVDLIRINGQLNFTEI